MAQFASEHPDELELVAVCDLVEEKAKAFAKDYGFESIHTDYVQMLEHVKPDGCVTVMPIEHTAALAIDLMRRGMPTTVEKPMGGTLDDIKSLVEVAKDTGTPNMVSVNRRFAPLNRKGIDWAREQGPIRTVRASILRHNRPEGSFVSGTAIHPIDTLREIGGDIASVTSRTLGGETPWFHFTFEHVSGAFATLEVLPTAGSVEERYEIFGEGYRVDVRHEPWYRARLRCWKDNKVVVDETLPEGQPEFVCVGPYAETEEFVKALEEGREPWPSVEEVFPSVELAFNLDPSKK